MVGRSLTGAVRFYVDADCLGLAKAMAGLRSDVTYPGDPGGDIRGRSRPACPVTRTDTPDEVWIPEVARRGWAILTRDRRIQTRVSETAALLASNARMFAITSPEQLLVWEQLEVVMCNWRRIEEQLGAPGPWVMSLTRTSMRSIDLTGG